MKACQTDALAGEHSQLQSQQAEAAETRQRLEEELATVSRVGEQRVRALEAELASSKANNARADADARAFEAEAEGVRQQVARLTMSLESSEAELKACQTDALAGERRYSADMGNAEQKLKAQAAELEQLQSRLLTAETTLETTVQSYVELTAERDKTAAAAETAVQHQHRHELAEMSQSSNKRVTALEAELEEVRQEQRSSAAATEQAQNQLATMSCRCEVLEQKIIAASQTAADQLVVAEEMADQRVSETEQLHAERHQLLQQEMTARLATTKEINLRSIEVLKQKCATELADSERITQARLTTEIEGLESQLTDVRASAKHAVQHAEAAAADYEARWARCSERTDALVVSRVRKELAWRCLSSWWRLTRSSLIKAASCDAGREERRVLDRVVQVWALETRMTSHRKVVAHRRRSQVASRLLLSCFDRWMCFRYQLRQARHSLRRTELLNLAKNFRRWAEMVRVEVLVNRCRSSADRELASAQSELDIAAQRVNQLEQELAQRAEHAADRAADSDARADERVQQIEQAMERRIQLLRQESQSRVAQIERAADVRYQQLVSSARSDAGSAEQLLAARSLQSEMDIAEVRDQAQASQRVMQAELEQAQTRLQQDRLDLKREAADELADLDSRMSERCAEIERRAEYLVSRAHTKADETVRRGQRASEQAREIELAELRQKYHAEIESTSRRAQTDFEQHKLESEEKLRAAHSEAARFHEAVTTATDRADAADRRIVVRISCVFEFCIVRFGCSLLTGVQLRQDATREAASHAHAQAVQQMEAQVQAIEESKIASELEIKREYEESHVAKVAKLERSAAQQLEHATEEVQQQAALAADEAWRAREALESQLAQANADAVEAAVTYKSQITEHSSRAQSKSAPMCIGCQRAASLHKPKLSLTGFVWTELAAEQECVQHELQLAKEEHAERFNQAKAEFDSKVATLVRLNDANTTIVQHKYDTDVEAAVSQMRSEAATDAVRAHEQAEQRLAAVIEQKDAQLLEIEEVCLIQFCCSVATLWMLWN